MPFDGNSHEFEKKPDVFSLEGLIAWLETQDPATEYDYLNVGGCLICNYLNACGIETHNVKPDGYFDLACVEHPLPKVLDEVAVGCMTYGAALLRAKAAMERVALASTPETVG